MFVFLMFGMAELSPGEAALSSETSKHFYYPSWCNDHLNKPRLNGLKYCNFHVCFSSSSSSSSVGTTARCGLWPVEKYLSIFSYLSPTLPIFSLPAFEDLFPFLLSILSWVFLFVSSLPLLE
jgi:hypothetical protein